MRTACRAVAADVADDLDGRRWKELNHDALITLGFLALALIGMPLFLVFGAAAMYLFANEPGGTITSVAIDVFSEKFADSPSSSPSRCSPSPAT